MKILTFLKDLWLSLKILGFFCTNRLNPVLLRPHRQSLFRLADYRLFAALIIGSLISLSPANMIWVIPLLLLLSIALFCWTVRDFARHYYRILGEIPDAATTYNDKNLVKLIMLQQEALSRSVSDNVKKALETIDPSLLQEATIIVWRGKDLTTSGRFFFGEGEIRNFTLSKECLWPDKIPSEYLPQWAQTNAQSS